MTAAPLEAVVFDVDGTLLRSIEQHAEAYRRTLEPRGVAIDPREVFLLEGARSESILREFLLRAGLKVEGEELREIARVKQAAYEALGMPGPYPGAFETVREVHRRGFRCALVTGTRRRNIDLLMGEVAHLFEVVRTQEDYTRDKPDPEPYLSAARGLGLPPERCLVLENAPRGVESARRAGMQVVAITNTLPAETIEEHAHAVVRTYDEFLALLPPRAGGVSRRS